MIIRYDFIWAHGGNYHRVELYAAATVEQAQEMPAIDAAETVECSRATGVLDLLKGKITPAQTAQLRLFMKPTHRGDNSLYFNREGRRG